ncbi:MAG: dCMP deaminase family protein [Clostridia bacterium]|nr:dCMP deaminase family protein [Clostridia bacterium]
MDIYHEPTNEPRIGTRPSWDEYFMQITDMVATRSTCLRRRVGAIFVRENRILATGYNGSPSGLKHCDEVGCIRQQNNIESGRDLHLCRGAHAEANLITQCAKFGISAEGSTLYINASPCSLCMKMMVNVGVKKIVYRELYNDPLALQIAEEAELEMIKYTDKGGPKASC